MLQLPRGTAGERDSRPSAPAGSRHKTWRKFFNRMRITCSPSTLVERPVPPGALRTRGTGQSGDRVEAQQHSVAQGEGETHTARHLLRSARICQIQCG
ncbi:conserved hypothetical protein [Xanthomonas citri pv. citri]|nr:conserved hypothetical protein [Xanthomonas citri pv. citri]CEJ47689.1 conserved hypothetical protein [Xanthomonas citri pv. bilvae]CEE39090.1 conserved hypothetical protein [Xanthomonas citri pv. citri]CEE46890.1 conserved hypothetical protein [Xanthomonas citri pv. citri]CEE75809.1 conserved hypothetical protein [Xanthomonas citri pv. citri]